MRRVMPGNNVDVVEPGMMTMEAMKQYQVVLLPFPYYIEEKTALLLKQWVAEGGMLISEALFGSVNAGSGAACTIGSRIWL